MLHCNLPFFSPSDLKKHCIIISFNCYFDDSLTTTQVLTAVFSLLTVPSADLDLSCLFFFFITLYGNVLLIQKNLFTSSAWKMLIILIFSYGARQNFKFASYLISLLNTSTRVFSGEVNSFHFLTTFTLILLNWFFFFLVVCVRKSNSICYSCTFDLL